MASILNATTSSGLVTSADNSGSLQLATNNGTTAVTIDTSQNVGIGTASPAVKLDVNSSAVGGNVATFRSTATNGGYVFFQGSGSSPTATGYIGAASKLNTGGSVTDFGMTAVTNLVFGTNDGTERMRITSGGDLYIGGTTGTYGSRLTLFSGGGSNVIESRQTGSGTQYHVIYMNSNGAVGSVTTTGSATSFNTSSDYRLKENIAPMTGALAKVAQLKPVTYTWKATGETSQGFIAHELQAIVPDCVTGEKDAVDDNGNPIHQGVDTSFLVATLTAAIQELKAELDATKAEVQALKGVA